MQTWTVELRFTGARPLTDAQAEKIAEHTDNSLHNAATGALTMWVTVTAEHVPAAHQQAIAKISPLLTELGLGDLTGASYDIKEAADREIKYPRHVQNLVTSAEAGRILNVTRERARALLSPGSPKRDPKAPSPAAQTDSAWLWTREAIELYAEERDPSLGAGKFHSYPAQ